MSFWFRGHRNETTMSMMTTGRKDGASTTTTTQTPASTKTMSVKEAIEYLYPNKHAASHSEDIMNGINNNNARNHRSRFSQLLLEHGEQHLQDWAVVANSSILLDTTMRNNDSQKTSSATSTTTSDSQNQQIQWAQSPNRNRKHQKSASSSTNKTNRFQQYHHHSSTRGVLPDKDSVPSAHMNKLEGRLHLCTGSLVFEPTDLSRAIVRCPFSRMDGPPREYPSSSLIIIPDAEAASYEKFLTVELEIQRHVTMKANNTISTFRQVHIPCRFRFTFLHSSPRDIFVGACETIYQACKQQRRQQYRPPYHNPPSSSGGNNNHPTKQNHNNHSAVMTGTMEKDNEFQQQTTSQEQQQQQSPLQLDVLMQSMLDRPFDVNNLVDVAREQVLTPHLRCSILTPLQSHHGVLSVTAERLYFQPATGLFSPSSSLDGGGGGGNTARSYVYELRDVVATARRYHGLRDSAFEIYWKDKSSTLFALERRHDREQVLRFLSSNHNIPCFTDREFVVQAAREWRNRNLSNYEYLLALNSAAGRSFHDLSRYPVFPWVIADYESSVLDLNNPATFRDLTKPMGALNPERLEYFQARLHGMQDMEEAFLYGTHYSAPGYVLYFLVRSMPEHMLCLQNGKFDAPDRMFHSIAQCYKCALTNHADVKELIPEFYNSAHNFDFLINAKGLHLGATQNGDRVDDVQLPPWARSARDFIKKNRKALESEFCTRSLPKWIDLIFGCKSRGEGAIEADNIFHHNAYLGPTDLAGMKTEEERYHAELHAAEFGIVPDLLFCAEHPAKGSHSVDNDEEFISLDIGRASSKDESGHEAWELLDAQSNEASTSAGDLKMGSTMESIERLDHDTNYSKIGSTTYQSTMVSPNDSWIDNNPKTDASTPKRQFALRGTGEGPHHHDYSETEREHLAPSVSIPTPGADSPRTTEQKATPTLQQATTQSSDWDMKIIERKQIHNDAVSGCVFLLDEREPNGVILVSTSLDGGLKAHKVSFEPGGVAEDKGPLGFASPFTKFSYNTIMNRNPAAQMPAPSKLTEHRVHSARDPLASLVVASDGAGGSIAFAGGHDDIVLAYGMKSACAVASLYSHRDAVTGLDLITRTALDTDGTIWLENSTHLLFTGSWDATLKIWSTSISSGETVAINREPIAELFDADASIVCVSAKSIPSDGIFIAAGCADGSFCVWNIHTDGVQVLIHKETARRGLGPCSVVKLVVESGKLHLFTASSTGRLVSYSIEDDALKRDSAVSIGVAVTSMIYTEGVLLAGCSDGGLRLIPVSEASFFGSKPTMWSSINNKDSSPGISSLSVTFIEKNGGLRCICCTGAEDGSVLLFELKKVHQPSIKL